VIVQKAQSFAAVAGVQVVAHPVPAALQAKGRQMSPFSAQFPAPSQVEKIVAPSRQIGAGPQRASLGRLLQAVVLDAGRQAWQSLAGLTVSAANATPPMQQGAQVPPQSAVPAGQAHLLRLKGSELVVSQRPEQQLAFLLHCLPKPRQA
jgi:hypothetical protein